MGAAVAFIAVFLGKPVAVALFELFGPEQHDSFHLQTQGICK
jgi:hypothetical protein